MQGKITKAKVDKLTPGKKDQFVWDTDLKGFGLKCTPTGAKIYILQYRVMGSGTPKRFTLGKHGTWTPETARKEAERLLRDISQGKDPAHTKALQKQTPTLQTFAARYLSDYAEPHKKPGSVVQDRLNLESHILPLLGSRKMDQLARADMAKLHHTLLKTPIAANRCLALCSTMLKLAEEWGIRPEGTNPCRFIKRYKEEKRTRFLSVEEVTRLGQALVQAEQRKEHSVFVVAAFRLLILTGARLGEILSLRWEYVDTDHSCLRLPDSKTGKKVVYLNEPALTILRQLPRLAGNPSVLPGARSGKPLVTLQKAWGDIRETAGLPDVRIHDLRHSFASVGAGAGLGLPIIGALLGHRQADTTQRYAHVANDPLKSASNLIGEQLAKSLGKPPTPEKKKPGRRLRVVE